MKIVIYGLTITSAWGNGHATTYRSLIAALAARGHHVRFIERDVPWYRENRDMPHPDFCSVRLYTEWADEESSLVNESRDVDAVIIGSYFTDAIAATQALLANTQAPLLFYDIDTPITLTQLRAFGRCEYLEARLVPEYAAYLSFTAGSALRELETRFGARKAIAFHCSVNPLLYKPTASVAEWRCDLSYLGTYAADRQAKLKAFLNASATALPNRQFVVAGAQYPAEITWPCNVSRIHHVAPADHPAFYSSSRFTLNLTRADMVEAGWSPSVRLFEASACGTPILSDRWAGMEDFFTPGEEIVLVDTSDDVTAALQNMPEEQRLRMGARARERALAEHTSACRAMQFEAIVSGLREKRVPQANADTLRAIPA